MKRLLFIEPVSFPTHYNYNVGILRNLPTDLIIDICALDGYISKTLIDYKLYYSIPENLIYRMNPKDTHPQLRLRWSILQVWLWIKKNIELSDYDGILFAYTEAITFRLTMNRLNTKRQKVMFIDHEIGSTVNSKIKLWFFTGINKDYTFLAFEDYIKDYLKDVVKLQNPISVVRHPLPKLDKLDEVHTDAIEKSDKKNLILYAPANSNNEDFIRFLFEHRDELSSDIRIVIKSKLIAYEDEKLKIFNENISDDEYKRQMRKCDAVLINYGQNYNFRTSGVFFEAVAYRKPIVLCVNNTMRYYSETYPEIVFPFENAEDFMNRQNIIREGIKLVHKSVFDKIIKDYSDNEINYSIETVIR